MVSLKEVHHKTINMFFSVPSSMVVHNTGKVHECLIGTIAWHYQEYSYDRESISPFYFTVYMATLAENCGIAWFQDF